MPARLVPPRHTYLLHKKAAENGEPLPVAIVIGCDPLIIYATSTRVPVGKEFEYAAALRGLPVEVFECENGVKVPHAEIVLEGYIDPVEKVNEGPFVDITGTYDVVRKEPVIRITRIIHRKDPIYHGILPAGPEHLLMMGIPYEPRIYRRCRRSYDCKKCGADRRRMLLSPCSCPDRKADRRRREKRYYGSLCRPYKPQACGDCGRRYKYF